MLSLSQFRHHLFPAFMMMKGTGQTFEVIYKGKVYDVSVRTTKKKPIYTRAKMDRKVKQVLPHRIAIGECGECGSVLVAGICMNTKCPKATTVSA